MSVTVTLNLNPNSYPLNNKLSSSSSMASCSSFSSFPTVRPDSLNRRRKPILAAGFSSPTKRLAGLSLPTVRYRQLNKNNNNKQPFSFVAFSSSQDEPYPSEEEGIDKENNDNPQPTAEEGIGKENDDDPQPTAEEGTDKENDDDAQPTAQEGIDKENDGDPQQTAQEALEQVPDKVKENNKEKNYDPLRTARKAWDQIPEKFRRELESMGFTEEEFEKAYDTTKDVHVTVTEKGISIQQSEEVTLVTMMKKLSRKFLAAPAAVDFPKPVKDVLETFASMDDSSIVHDFYVGILYGTFLCVCGLLNFVLIGRISALRFGVGLGGILLALGLSSLRSWRRKESTDMFLIGQLAIAVILFARDVNLLFLGVSFGLVKAVISAGVLAFYLYRWL